MKSLNEILFDEQTYTTVVMTILISKYGTEFLEWDPVTVGLSIKDDFGKVPPRYLMDKIQAGSALLTSDLYFKSLETFSALNDVLNLSLFDASTFVPASLDDCLWGCTEAKLMLGEDYTNDYSHDIAGYVGLLLAEEGIYTAPSVLAFAEYPNEESLTDQNDVFQDEVMYKAFWEGQHETRQQLDKDMQLKLITLFTQLKELPVKDIDKEFVEGFLTRLQQSIND
jgi:hypothetical protein